MAWRLGALTTAMVVALAGCGRGDDNGGQAAPGVTDEPCPEAVDSSKGCIYLGAITDLTGPFKGVGVPVSEGQKAFWSMVNADGGIGDYEIDVTTYMRDSQYNPDVHARLFGEINGDVLAMSQSLGTDATEAMLNDGDASDLVVFPLSLGSNWLFEDQVVEIGSNYCAEAMNAVDYGADELDVEEIAAIHFPGDYGDDAAVGARIAAEARDLTFTDIPTSPGDNQAAAIAALLDSDADLAVVSTGPIELAAIVGGALAQGYTGKFIGSVPTWNGALLETPAGPALESVYLWANPFPGWDADTPGAGTMREAAQDADPNDYYAIGWTSGYVLKTILEEAVAAGDLTREGLLAAATSLESVDAEGTLPDGSGNYAGDPNEAVVRATNFFKPGAGSTGASLEVASYTGPTAEEYDFQEACYLQQ